MEYYTGSPAQSRETAFQPSATARVLALGPITEPFYIVPQSTLCDLLRDRNAAISQNPAQQTFYMPHRADSSQYSGDLPLSVQGPFAPTDVFPPLLEPFSGPHSDPFVDSASVPAVYASGYGYESPGQLSGPQYLYPTQHWNSPLPSTIPRLPYADHAAAPSLDISTTGLSPVPPQSSSQRLLHPPPAPDRFVHAHDTRSPSYEAPAINTLRAPACTHCYRSRKKCGWERPCKRCMDGGLMCAERERAGRRNARELGGEPGFALHDAAPVLGEGEGTSTAVGADISLAEAASSGRLPRTPTAGHASYGSGQE